MALFDRILLATDLSARSDRALDRATMLARREGAELVVLHVIEPVPGNRYYPYAQPLPPLATIARQQLAHDLGDCLERTRVRIEQGEPAEVIERVAREERSTLIVVGVARVERFGRYSLGATVEKLVRAVEAPLLIVTDRPRAPYRRVAVAVDFSSVSHQTVALASSTFPEQPITVFHVHQPMATYGAPDTPSLREQLRQIGESDMAAFLASLELAPDARARVAGRVELGDPARTISDVAERGDFDLVVVGTRGRGRLFDFFIGSVARRILDHLPCDALFVRESR